MKKWISGSMAFILCFTLTACAAKPVNDETDTAALRLPDKITPEENANTQNTASNNEPDTPPSSSPEDTSDNPCISYDKVDIDLTTFSEVMLFAELYNMMNTPSNYIGKIVKMKGNFKYYQNPETQETHYSVYQMDATACCTQGLDFVLADPSIHLEELVAEDAEITVTGRFDIYLANEEYGIMFHQLVDACFE